MLIPLLAVAHLCHEAGHLLAAWLLGVRPNALQLGFGKVRTLAGDRLQLRIATVPLAVFYRFDGPGFDSCARWKRALVALAGPATSWLLSFAVLLGLSYGTEQPTLVIERVSPSSAAERAGIRPGDRIVHLGEKKVETFQGLRDAVQAHPGGPVTVSLDRDGARQAVQAELAAGGPLGIVSRQAQLRGATAIAAAALGTVLGPLDQLGTIARLLWERPRYQAVGGPIMMYESAPGDRIRPLAGAAADLFALISLPFFLLPLLPIPRFDAARLFAAIRAR
jgi:regulator of sigma E protease